MTTFPEPGSTDDLRGLLLDYLDFYRDVITAKYTGLDDASARSSRLPSGWTPTGLVVHLTYMERRWLQWGFLGEDVVDPWGDSEDDGWRTPTTDRGELVRALHEGGVRTRQIVTSHQLTDVASTGGRFATPAEAPQLHWILLHVLQEYARHAGHLDIVRELADGDVGEEG